MNAIKCFATSYIANSCLTLKKVLILVSNFMENYPSQKTCLLNNCKSGIALW